MRDRATMMGLTVRLTAMASCAVLCGAGLTGADQEPAIPAQVGQIAQWMEAHRPQPPATQRLALYVQLVSAVEGHPIDVILRGDGTNWSPAFARIDWHRDAPPKGEFSGGRFGYGPDGTICDEYTDFRHPLDAADLRLANDSLAGSVRIQQQPIRRSEFGSHGIMTDNRYVPKPLDATLTMKKTGNRFEGQYTLVRDTNHVGLCFAYLVDTAAPGNGLFRLHLHNALGLAAVPVAENATNRTESENLAAAGDAVRKTVGNSTNRNDIVDLAAVSNALLQAEDDTTTIAGSSKPAAEVRATLHLEVLSGPWGVLPIRAYAPDWNKLGHLLDSSKLTWANGRLAGPLSVRLIGEGKVPPASEDIAATINISVTSEDGSISGAYEVVGAPAVLLAATGLVSGTVVPFLEPPSLYAPPKPPSAPKDPADPLYRQSARDYVATCLRTARVWMEAASHGSEIGLWEPAKWAPACSAASNDFVSSIAGISELLMSWDTNAYFAVGRLLPDDPTFGPYYHVWARPIDTHGGPGVSNAIGKSPSGDWIAVTNWQMLGPLPLQPNMPSHPRIPPLIAPAGVEYECPDPRRPSNALADNRWQPATFTLSLLATGRAPSIKNSIAAHPWTSPPKWDASTNRDRFGCRYWAYAEIHFPASARAYISLCTETFLLKRGEDGRARCLAWLNNRPLWCSDQPYDDLFENAAILPIQLKAGTNFLLLELSTERFVEVRNGRGKTFRDGLGFRCHINTSGTPRSPDAVREWEAARRKSLAANPLPEIIGFRGNMHGVYKNATPVAAWNLKEGINIRWRTAMTNWSNASPLVIQNRLFVNCEPGTLFCLDKNTGKILWQREHGTIPAANGDGERKIPFPVPAWGNMMGTSYATPVSDGELIWVTYGNSVTACYDLDGNRRWILIEDTDPGNTCTSPVLCGDLLVMRGRRNVMRELYIARDKLTGKERWRTLLQVFTDTGNAVPVRLSNGREFLDVLATENGCLLRCEDGAVLRDDIGLQASGACTAATVVDDILVFPDEHIKMAAVRLVMIDRDTVAVRPTWKPTWWSGGQSHFYTGAFSVHHNGLIYSATICIEHSRKTPIGWQLLNVVDASNGALVRRIKPAMDFCGHGYTPSTIAGRYLFLVDAANHSGMCSDARPGGKDTESLIAVYDTELGQMVASSPMPHMQAPPAFDQDRIYVRTLEEVICIAKTGPEGEAYERNAMLERLSYELARRRLPTLDETVHPIPAAAAIAPDQCPVVSLDNAGAVPAFIVAGPYDGPASTTVTNPAAVAAIRPARGLMVDNKPFGDFDQTLLSGTRSWRDVKIDYLDFLGRRKGAYAYWGSTIRVDSRSVRRLRAQGARAIYLSGQLVKDGQLLRLEPGYHSLLALIEATAAPPKSLSFAVTAQFGLSVVPNPETQYKEWLENALPFKKRIEWALEQTGGKGEYAAEFKTALDRLNRASQGK